jgi:hypothetical protein
MTSTAPKSMRRGGIVAMVLGVGAALAVAIAVPATARSEIPSASATAASVLDSIMPSHQHVGLRAHGFVADNGNFTTIDAPRATTFTIAWGSFSELGGRRVFPMAQRQCAAAPSADAVAERRTVWLW